MTNGFMALKCLGGIAAFAFLGVLGACGGGTDVGVGGAMDSGADANIEIGDGALSNVDGAASGDDGSIPTSQDCDPDGVIGLQATPGFKSAEGALTVMGGNINLNGETLTGKKITGTVRGHGTIKDSWIAADAFIAVMNDDSEPLILEDVTIGGTGTYGDLAVASEGSGGVVLRRVRVEGYADCYRNGPFDIENSWCTTTAQSETDHNDGYQAYQAGEVDVSIRCSQIDSNTHTNAGIFHADGSQVRFTLQNIKFNINHNYCIRLHSAAKYDELPNGDNTDDSRVLRMENIDCQSGGEGVWVDSIPVDEWSNVKVNGSSVPKP